MTWLLEHWHLIVGGIAALAGGGVLAWPKVAMMLPTARSDKPDYRRGLDALEILLDELRKAGVPNDELTDWKIESVQALVKPTK